jgi:hypothetical protein
MGCPQITTRAAFVAARSLVTNDSADPEVPVRALSEQLVEYLALRHVVVPDDVRVSDRAAHLDKQARHLGVPGSNMSPATLRDPHRTPLTRFEKYDREFRQ